MNYNNNIGTSAQVAFNLDADGNAAATLVDGVETLVTARDADERIKTESFQPYASPSPSYGGLTYTYDADGQVIDKGGTLAVVNIPPAASAAYSTTDQITTWSGTPTNPDKASNIINDPNGLTFKWNPRNQLSTVSGGVAALFYYDGLGRRELSNATPPGAIQDFEYDGSSMIGWNTGVSSPSYNFLTIPGGGALAGSFTSGGTTTTWVPVVDASGSTLGLVNAASPQSGMATTYTYDPSGTSSASGTANEWPFQYLGREKQFTDPAPYYYSGSGQFYSPQFARSLTEAGETSAGGTGGGFSPAGNAIARPSSVSVSGFDPTNLHNDERSAESVGGGAAAGALAGALIGTEGGPFGALAGAAIGASIGAAVSFFEALFGGGSNTPPTPRQLLHGRHPLYLEILGIQNGLIPDAVSAAPRTPSPNPPLGKPCSLISRIGHCAYEHYGLGTIGLGLSALGIPIPKAWLPAPVYAGTSEYTSAIRALAFKIFGEDEPRLGFRILGTPAVFGIIGRAAQFVGPALLAYDAIAIAYCVEFQN